MKIIMYTKTGCPWCKGAIDLLNSKGVTFEEREVRGNAIFYKELVDKSGQEKTPTLDIDGEILADVDADQIAEYMKGKNIPGF
ncbi:MAG: glutaredoxin [Candidatus Taylorbacteria bacterium]|nr:glutaredoxin [Candidatus Taylorbacteria bacterium]